MKQRVLQTLFAVLVFSAIVGQENQQQIDYQGKIAMAHGCAELIASIIKRSCMFFRREPVEYDVQKDLLDIPFKCMVYRTTQQIEELFSDANCHDNPLLQIKAIIMLCRMPIPEWYMKSFSKGIDQLYQLCFDEAGNFQDATNIGDIRVLFKEYCRKSPVDWQQIVRISPWWYKRKKPYGLHTKYYAQTCTDFNENLLRMIELDPSQNYAYLRYLYIKNKSAAASKIYRAHFENCVKKNISVAGWCKEENL